VSENLITRRSDSGY